MAKTLFQKIVTRVDKAWYEMTHPVFAKKYAHRFSADFTQEDLEYCIPHLYKLRTGKELDLNNVKTFNEKLNWLKCYYHDDKTAQKTVRRGNLTLLLTIV